MYKKKLECVIILGRRITTNINREENIASSLNDLGIKCHIVILGKNIDPHGFDQNDQYKFSRPIYYIDSIKDLINLGLNDKIVLTGSTPNRASLFNILDINRNQIIVYNDASGLDFWDCGASRILLKGNALHTLYVKSPNNPFEKFRRRYLVKHKNCGSLRYHGISYGLRTLEKHVTLFPKNLAKFDKEYSKWLKPEGFRKHIFPNALEIQYRQQFSEYGLKVREMWKKIVSQLKSIGIVPRVKLHPSVYEGWVKNYQQDRSDEFLFWTNLGIEIINHDAPEHLVFESTSVGIGINSLSGIDVNYFKRPFIYVTDPHIAVLPPKIFRNSTFFKDLLSNVKKDIAPNYVMNNPHKYLWLPNWCGRIVDVNYLSEAVSRELLNDHHYDYKFINELFWSTESVKDPAASIANFVYKEIYE